MYDYIYKDKLILSYISIHANIDDLLKILEVLEKEGCVHRGKYNKWSPSNYPQFEITTKGKQKLKEN